MRVLEKGKQMGLHRRRDHWLLHGSHRVVGHHVHSERGCYQCDCMHDRSVIMVW